MQLEFKTECYNVIEYHSLEHFIQSTYGIEDYDFVAFEECENNSSRVFKADGYIPDYLSYKTEKIRKHGEIDLYCTHILFNLMVIDKHLPEGMYLVKVSW